MDFDWKICLAIFALIIGILRLLFPEQFRQIGYFLWPVKKHIETERGELSNRKDEDRGHELIYPAEPLIPNDLNQRYPNIKLDKVLDLVEDAEEYSRKGDLKKEIKTYEKLMKKLMADGVSDPLPKILLILGNLAVKMKDYPRAKRHYTECLSVAKDLGDNESSEKASKNMNLLD